MRASLCRGVSVPLCFTPIEHSNSVEPSMTIRLLAFILLLLPVLASSAEDDAKVSRPLAETAPRPHPVEPPTRDDIDKAIRSGVDYLLADQRPEGCWGSAERTKDLNIYAPVP